MATLEWLKHEFRYGYDSGDVLNVIADPVRASKEAKIGGSYRRAFIGGCVPFLQSNSTVLELGPGRGSWSRALLRSIPDGKLVTVDFQDVRAWICPELDETRLVCIQSEDNSISAVPDGLFDFILSIGVLCHANREDVADVLRNSLAKAKPGGHALHHYGDSNKLDAWGRDRGGVPTSFRDLPDESIWWPRNSRSQMSEIAETAGWRILEEDLNFFERDGMILLERPR